MSDSELQLTYRSERGLSPLAEGLIIGSGDLFETPLRVAVLSQSVDPPETLLSVQLVN